MKDTTTTTGSTKNRSRSRLAIGGMTLALAGVVGVSGYAISTIMRSPQESQGEPIDQIAPTIARQLETIPAIVESARTYLDQEKPGRAKAVLEAALEAHPTEQQLYFLLGEAYLQQENLASAYDAYDQGIIVGEDHAEYRFAAGTLASQLGRLQDAELHFLRAQKLDGNNPKYPLYLAQIQRKLGMVDEAKANLLMATNLDPELAYGWSSLAAIALDENKISIARQHIARARELEPENLAWRVMEAQTLRRGHEPDKAVALLMAIDAQTRRASPGLLVELARSYGLLQQPEKAAAEYVEATAAHPDNAEFPYQAGVWLERAGDMDRSLQYARHAAQKGHSEAALMVDRLEQAGE